MSRDLVLGDVTKVLGHPIDVREHVCMRDHDALGDAGRPGREKYVSQCVIVDARTRRRLDGLTQYIFSGEGRLLGPLRCISVDPTKARRGVGNVCRLHRRHRGRVGDHHGGLSRCQNQGDPRRRRIGIDWYVGRAGLGGAEHRCDRCCTFRQTDRHPVAGKHTETDEQVCDLVRSFAEFAVGRRQRRIVTIANRYRVGGISRPPINIIKE